MIVDSPGLVAVVGGRGVIGAGIVAALRAVGWKVVVVTHDRDIGAHPGYRYGDMLDSTTLGPALENADVVVQSANFPNYPFEKQRRRHTFMEFDGIGTERLIKAAQAVGTRRYMYISGVGVGEDPAKPYYQAIWRGELAVASSGLDAVILRPAFVFGPKDNGINKIIRACRRGLPVLPLPGGGLQMHQPVFVADVGKAASKLCAPGAPTGLFEIGGPDRLTMADMLRTALRMVELGRPIVSVPVGLARFGATLLQRLPGPLLTRSALDFILEDFVADNTHLLANVDLRLTSFEEGLRGYLAPVTNR